MKNTKKYWISWYQSTDDPRPITVPQLKDGVIGYWVSGECMNGDSVVFAVALITSMTSYRGMGLRIVLAFIFMFLFGFLRGWKP
jgi:hypothetical protein